MLGTAREVYVTTRKKNDFAFNLFVMRPLAALVVAGIKGTGITPNQVTLANLAIFVVAAALFVTMPTFWGGVLACVVIEAAYCLDCVDGMLARYKKIASKTGHLFDFFTDEMKAVLLVSVLGVRLYFTGGYGLDAKRWPPDDVRFLFAALIGCFVLASAISLTNFVRRPELSGKETTVEAHYETVENKGVSFGGLFTGALRILNHYPTHIYLFALASRLDVYFWIYVALNLLYLARGWLGLVVRFGLRGE